MAKKKLDIRPCNYIVIEHFNYKEEADACGPLFFSDEDEITEHVARRTRDCPNITHFSFIPVVEMFEARVTTAVKFTAIPPVEIDT